eukprot:SAG11_NODE_8835_length_971_cov_2.926606_1_plen_41_part_01
MQFGQYIYIYIYRTIIYKIIFCPFFDIFDLLAFVQPTAAGL